LVFFTAQVLIEVHWILIWQLFGVV
jgi:hypothetical protein